MNPGEVVLSIQWIHGKPPLPGTYWILVDRCGFGEMKVDMMTWRKDQPFPNGVGRDDLYPSRGILAHAEYKKPAPPKDWLELYDRSKERRKALELARCKDSVCSNCSAV